MKNNLFRLVSTIICHLRIEKEKIYLFWERLNQTLKKCIPAENKIKKNKNSEDFLLNIKQVFSCRYLENLSGEHGRQNPRFPVWACVQLAKLQRWKRPRWTRNPVQQIEFSQMVLLLKLRKDTNQIKMRLLPRNSRS